MILTMAVPIRKPALEVNSSQADSGAAFAEFFQIDKFTGKKKGILAIALAADETVAQRTMS